MSARIADSSAYAHLWGTDELRQIFEERARLQGWLDVLAALARAQAAEGFIPADAASIITDALRVDRLDLDRIARGTRETGHSTLGLIHELRRMLPEAAREHVYAGATVQDVTDTWTSLAMRAVGGIVWRDLRRIEERLLTLAVEHRETPIAGRTHGQPGAPATFGWKAASWADEIRRHLDRLREGAPRWLVAQLGGGIGTLVAYGDRGLAIRARFAAELGLDDPVISWLSARDRIAEFGNVLALVTGTLARVGEEVYELQRPEIGELGEPRPAGVVGSITMHHKRNPEGSEHLNTLARLVRAHAGVLMESVVSQHERDGRAWKAEWVALPEVCLLSGTALALGVGLVEGLEVHSDRMAANVRTYLGDTQNPSDTGSATGMVDLVVARARRIRTEEPHSWPSHRITRE
ncbi:adenylosuccinate lyase family protein [Streptosporangium sp. NBC_01755]|uniref:class-II fumarase/aspartase family protein n=1 Tax=Streptosporangium sp. NBC_01755 TaxID=2975949 RepID=UPI002DD9117A|nr:adenylosuccinate lyase family protein [Streptosporangium sp. NBC_01755]WSD02121.1 adenylosuccinate lyase family protein [Streptosporangium sp. NBC_01755]